jgi:hypothetical protein
MIESENGLQIVCQSNPQELTLKKVFVVSKHSETVRAYRAEASIYSFMVHVSNQYLLILTEAGRVEIHR